MTINIQPIIDQAGMALQKQAAGMLGAAVQDFTRQTLGAQLGTQSTAINHQRRPGEQPTRPQGSTFVASSYAAALAGGTDYRPKMKFLFKVEFIFTEQARRAYPSVFDDKTTNDFTFLVKTVDRPKIDFEYEDDVNMYNFRTKALKRIRHRELSMTFLDDTGNRVLNLFRALMMVHSPITRRQLQREGTTATPDPTTLFAGNGMMYAHDYSGNTMDNAHRAAVNSLFGNSIQGIRLKQMYVDPSAANASSEVIFDFMNARIVSFDLDDLSHDLSEPSIITMQFDYDWLEMVVVNALAMMDGPHPSIQVPGSTAPIDMSPQPINQSAAIGRAGPFASIIGGAAGRVVNTISTDLVNRTVQTIAGKGMFGQIVGNYASNAVAGIVGGATRDIVTGASQVLSNATTSLAAGILGDSGLGRVTRAVGVTTSTSDPLGNFISNLKL